MASSSTDREKRSAAGQVVRIQNGYASVEYPSIEAAASSLSQIGVLTKEEVLRKLLDREGYINGYVVTYL